MIVVDDHGAFGAEQLDAVGLAERRIVGRQRVADAEVDHRAVGEGHDRPGHVVRAVAGLLEDAVLAARHHLDRPVAFEEPAHQVDVVGQHVEHRRGVRIALEDRERLRARVVDARRAADDLAEPAVQHLLLGAQEAFLVAAAVADAQVALGLAQRLEDRVGVGEREADRLLDQHRLAELERLQDRRGVLLLRRRDDHRGDVGMRDDLLVAAGVDDRRRPARRAPWRAPGRLSEIARNRTHGCLAASRARSVPMRPAPTTAMPILSCFIALTRFRRDNRPPRRARPRRRTASARSARRSRR